MSSTRPRHRRSRRLGSAVVLAVAALIAVVAVPSPGVATAPAGAPVKARPKQPRVQRIGTFAVGKISETYVDSSRPTDPNHGFSGAPNRTLLTAIYYPAKGAPSDQPVDHAPPDTKHGPYPLILFSHGWTARGETYVGNIKKWASAGYIIAAPDYPLSSTNAPGGAIIGDVKNQPADASFVIDQVIKDDKTKRILGGTVDSKHIGAAGHSLGAITTYGLVYSACCSDKRIKAAIPMSGLAGLVDDGANYFHGPNTPLLILHGNADPLVPYQSGINAFDQAKPPKFFLTFTSAGHVQPFVSGDDPQAIALQKSTVDFWDRYLKGNKGALGRLDTDANMPGATSFQEQTR